MGDLVKWREKIDESLTGWMGVGWDAAAGAAAFFVF
jgi:hypothetical protein